MKIDSKYIGVIVDNAGSIVIARSKNSRHNYQYQLMVEMTFCKSSVMCRLLEYLCDEFGGNCHKGKCEKVTWPNRWIVCSSKAAAFLKWLEPNFFLRKPNLICAFRFQETIRKGPWKGPHPLPYHIIEERELLYQTMRILNRSENEKHNINEEEDKKILNKTDILCKGKLSKALSEGDEICLIV